MSGRAPPRLAKIPSGMPTITAGNLVNDAHLAALAVEHAAEVVSFDRDFGRFPGLRWRPPVAGLT